jgi:hypothetical protein
MWTAIVTGVFTLAGVLGGLFIRQRFDARAVARDRRRDWALEVLAWMGQAEEELPGLVPVHVVKLWVSPERELNDPVSTSVAAWVNGRGHRLIQLVREAQERADRSSWVGNGTAKQLVAYDAELARAREYLAKTRRIFLRWADGRGRPEWWFVLAAKRLPTRQEILN